MTTYSKYNGELKALWTLFKRQTPCRVFPWITTGARSHNLGSSLTNLLPKWRWTDCRKWRQALTVAQGTWRFCWTSLGSEHRCHTGWLKCYPMGNHLLSATHTHTHTSTRVHTRTHTHTHTRAHTHTHTHSYKYATDISDRPCRTDKQTDS